MTKNIIIGFAVLSLVVTSGRAATNSWKIASSDYWDEPSAWLLGVPDIAQGGALITNATGKTVTIDSIVSTFSPSTMTISNLVLSGPVNTTNTLFLSNAGLAVPLRILKGLSIGSGGVLQATNSFLQVDGLSGGSFNIDGIVRMTNGLMVTTNAVTTVGPNVSGALTVVGGTWLAGTVNVNAGTVTFNGGTVNTKFTTIANGATLQFALGSNSAPVYVSNDLTLGGTLNVTDAGGFSNTTYTLFIYSGALTYNGLTIGTTPNGAVCTIDIDIPNQVNLVVSNTGAPPLPVQVTSIVRQGNNINITWNTSGASNTVQVSTGAGGSGSYSNNFSDLSTIIITTPTTNYVDVGGATNSPSRFYRIRSP